MSLLLGYIFPMTIIYQDPYQLFFLIILFLMVGLNFVQNNILTKIDRSKYYFLFINIISFNIFAEALNSQKLLRAPLLPDTRFKITFRVLGFCRACSRQVKVRLVTFTKQDNAAQAVCGKHSRHPARCYRRLGLVIVAQACEHGVVVHLVFFLRVFLIFFHLKHNGSPYI